jgi:hypothetical protein
MPTYVVKCIFLCFTQRKPTFCQHINALNYYRVFVSSIGYCIFNFELDVAWQIDSSAHYEKVTDWQIICTYFIFLKFKSKISLILRNYMYFLETDIAVLAKMSQKYRPNLARNLTLYLGSDVIFGGWAVMIFSHFILFHRFIFFVRK